MGECEHAGLVGGDQTMIAPSLSSYRTLAPTQARAAPTPARYPSDVDDVTWDLIAPNLKSSAIGGRPRTHSDRVIYNAILYVLRGGIPWRYLPKTYPPWQTVYGRFRTWADTGVWRKLTTTVRQTLPIELGRDTKPSA